MAIKNWPASGVRYLQDLEWNESSSDLTPEVRTFFSPTSPSANLKVDANELSNSLSHLRSIPTLDIDTLACNPNILVNIKMITDPKHPAYGQRGALDSTCKCILAYDVAYGLPAYIPRSLCRKKPRQKIAYHRLHRDCGRPRYGF